MAISLFNSDKKAYKRHTKVLEQAEDYATWERAARALDSLDGLETWRENETSADYNYRLIRQRLKRLRALRADGKLDELIYFLDENLHRNTGNIGNPSLYREARTGTKYLIDEYVDEVCNTLNYLLTADLPDFGFSEKYKFFRRTGQAFGRSALLFSGGATLGMFHVGMAKALWEQNLLPRVMSGSSAGSIVAGVIASKTDDEILHAFDPHTMNLNPWQRLSLSEMRRSKSVMNGEVLRDCLEENIGNLTFGEAFEKTGRIINITISPTEKNQTPRLMNYMNSPHVLIWSASQASCAVPGLFPAVTLMAKRSDGRIVPYNPTHKWIDGSVRSDLPMLRLARLHNVNHYIVSQTNPHVVPFIQEGRVAKRKKPSAIADIVKRTSVNQAELLLDLSRRYMRTNIGRRVLDEAHAVLAQQYSGDINIHPPIMLSRYIKTISNPTADDLAMFVLDGERATWPKIEMIRVHTRISKTFEECIDQLKHQSGRFSHPSLSKPQTA